MSIIYSTLSKLIKPFVGSGIGNFKPAADLYQKVITRVLPKLSKIIDIDGIKIEVSTGEYINDISTELLFKGIHEPMTTKVFKQILKSGDTVIDIGANVGYFTLLSSKLIGYKGTVYAFEPDADNMRELLHNAELNHFENIKPYQIAVSNKTSRAIFYMSSSECARHSLIKTKEHDNNTIVEVDKIDNIVTGNIKLLKTDTEGNEFAVLQGAEKTILNNKDIVLIVEVNFEALEACKVTVEQLLDYIIRILEMKWIYLINDYKKSIDLLDNDRGVIIVNKPRNKKELGYNLLCSRHKIEI